MLSLVAGHQCGVAKNINPILVRAPQHEYTPWEWTDLLTVIWNDLPEYSSVSTSVLLTAVYFPRSRFTKDLIYHPPYVDGFEARAWLLLKQLVSRGVTLVTGSGNSGHNVGALSDGWPANFGKTNTRFHIPSLMVVGSVDGTGKELWGRADLANGIPQFYAPGLKLSAADGAKANWGNPPTIGFQYKDSTGTSSGKFTIAGFNSEFAMYKWR